MDLNQSFMVGIYQFLYALPALAGQGVGIILSIVFRRRNPGKFRLTLISFSMSMANSLVSTFFSVWFLTSVDLDITTRGAVMQGANICSSIVRLVSLTLLFLALFNPKYNPAEAAVASSHLGEQ
jgi:hypothetical protein